MYNILDGLNNFTYKAIGYNFNKSKGLQMRSLLNIHIRILPS